MFSELESSGGFWRNRMALGSTDTISPGASLVFAFWCYTTKLIPKKSANRKGAHQDTIQSNVPMNDEPSRLPHRMGKTTSKNEDVYSSFHLCPHQTPHRRKFLFLNIPPTRLLQLLRTSTHPPRIRPQIIIPSASQIRRCLSRPDIRYRLRKIPSLEYFFRDMISVISS